MSLPATAPDLYQILGVSRDASQREIKRAYRAASKKCHPDMEDGSAEAFAKIQHAYGVLGDAERRSRYDATGDATEQQPDNSTARIHSFIMGAFDRAMQADDVDYRDIVGSAVRHLEEDRSGGEIANQQLRGNRDKLLKVRKRLRFTGTGPNLIDNTLSERIGEIERNIASNETIMELVGQAIERLRDGWEYDVEVRRAPEEAWKQSVYDQVWRAGTTESNFFKMQGT